MNLARLVELSDCSETLATAGYSDDIIGSAAGKMLVREKFARKQLLACTANIQTSLVGLETCSRAAISSAGCCTSRAQYHTCARIRWLQI